VKREKKTDIRVFQGGHQSGEEIQGGITMTTFTEVKKSRLAIIKPALARRPITAYFVLAFAFTWLFNLPMILGQDGLGLLPYSVPLPLYVVLFIIGAYGPTAAAVLVTSAVEGREGVRDFFRRYRQWRFGIRWYVFVLVAFPLVFLAGAVIWQGIEALQKALSSWQLYFTQFLPGILIFPALITWGEEPGWRGFAQTRLQPRSGPLMAALLVGFLHGVWHLPIYLLVNGPVAVGPFNLSSFLFNIFVTMVVTIIFTWAFNNTRQSILMAVLVHASLNASQSLIQAIIDPYPEQAYYIAVALILAAATVLIVATKGRLSYQANQTEQQQE
jgi:uncharacterized protein